MTARHHHFLSQCYLRGFTKGSSKKSKLSVVDLSQKRYFETKPRNVGGIRDFNRIDADGVDQNILEKSLAEFEGEAARALKSLSNSAELAGDERDLILNLIGLLAVRSPQMREHMRKFHAQIAERLMDLTLVTKERWESQMEQMQRSGADVPGNVSYEEVKRFHDSKAYTIEVAREHHIGTEMTMFEAVLPTLFDRRWSLMLSNTETGAFITSDRPVVLGWNEPQKIPPLHRSSPGFGLKDTHVYFPVSKGVALLGQFEGIEKTVDGSTHAVATLNSRILHSSYSQIYAPNLGFRFLTRNGEIMSGKQLIRGFGS